MSQSFLIENVADDDASAIATITNYYILHSVATFYLPNEQRTEFDIRAVMESIKSHDLPYIVAKDSKGSVIAFAYSSPYRWERAAYRSTVEITIYARPDAVGSGVGKDLLTELIQRLRTRKPSVKEVLSIMAYESNSEMERVARFYQKMGFVERGHVVRVGKKFGRFC